VIWFISILLVILLTGCVLIIGTENSVKTHDEQDVGLINTEKTTTNENDGTLKAEETEK